jgi:single-strand DNA-binding protein
MSLNVVHLIGRVGKDPDIKYLNNSKVVCKLTLAVNRASRNSDEPDWFNLEMWDKTAEVAANYIRKGKQIGVKGYLKFDTWSDRTTGANRSSPVILVEKLELLGSRKEDEANSFSGGGGM